MKTPLGAVAVLALSAGATAQPTTTVITHGLQFTNGDPPVLPAWSIGLADAIAARSPSGLVYIYHPPTGEWLGPASPQPGDDIVLVFDWVDESDGGIFCPFPFPGENWNYTEGAGDALYAALRDPSGDLEGFDLLGGRFLHMMGHSRGPSVLDKTARLLGHAGLTVDHLTAMDPHPVNNTLDQCLLFGTQIWGDLVAAQWENVTFFDNYYRTDSNICDLDGMPLGVLDVLLPENVLENGGYGFSHSDTHLWYHGTVDLGVNITDGEETITQAMRDTWWTGNLDESITGFHYSRIGGGVLDRPVQPVGPTPETPDILINGDFEQGSLFGWMGHTGGGTAEVRDDAGGEYLRLTPSGSSMTHNWFYLPECGRALELRYRVPTPSADDRLLVSVTDRSGAVTQFNAGAIPLDSGAGWTSVQVDLGSIAPDQSLLLSVDLIDDLAGPTGATVDIDDLEILTGLLGDANADGTVNFMDITTTLANWLNDYSPGTGPGDANLDGTVDFADVTASLGNWLTTCL